MQSVSHSKKWRDRECGLETMERGRRVKAKPVGHEDVLQKIAGLGVSELMTQELEDAKTPGP
jgi:hypothetical protein